MFPLRKLLVIFQVILHTEALSHSHLLFAFTFEPLVCSSTDIYEALFYSDEQDRGSLCFHGAIMCKEETD